MREVRERGFGDAEPVADGVWSIRMPLGAPHNPSVLCYVVVDADGTPHLIDSGLGDDACADALEQGLGQLGFALGTVRTVTMTHLHGDHTGLAARVAAAGGARTAIHVRESAEVGRSRAIEPRQLAEWGVPEAEAAPLVALQRSPVTLPPIDVLLEDGQRLDVPGRQLRVLHTPGHTDGHVCIVSDDERLVFTGDHLLPDQFAGVGLGGLTAGNPLRDYRDSLELLRPLGGYLVLPGHGWVFGELAERVDETFAHHGRRTAEVAAVLAAEPDASVWQIASQLSWTAGWDALAGFYRWSALRQTAWHRDLVLEG